MSAFIVSDHTINKVVHLLAPTEVGTPIGHQLADDLVNLNCDSVAGRYSHIEEMLAECREWRQPFATAKMDYTPAELAKAARCFLHQSCEAGCDRRPLYQQVKLALAQMPAALFTSPEYEAAAWD